jgi:hypothetical protein
MTDREIMQQALRVIKQLVVEESDDAPALQGSRMRKQGIEKALRERLAQPEQEPVATVQCIKGITIDPVTGNVGIGTPAQPAQQEVDWKDQYEKQKRRADMWVAKYEKDIGPIEYAAPAAQRQWVGLTDAELVDMHAALMVKLRGCYETKDLYRAIEQRLKDKNT